MEWRELETVLKKHPEIIEGAKQPGNQLRLIYLLADYFPTEKRNIRLLKLALDINILHELEAKPVDVPLARRLSKRLTDDFFIQEDMAVWAVDMWIRAYGGGVLGKAVPCIEKEKREERRKVLEGYNKAVEDYLAERQKIIGNRPLEKNQHWHLEGKKRQEEEKQQQEARRRQEEKRWPSAEKWRPLNADVLISLGESNDHFIQLFVTKWDGNSKVSNTKYDVAIDDSTTKPSWTWDGMDIIAIAKGVNGKIGLKSDGTIAIDWHSYLAHAFRASPSSIYNNVLNWKDIVAIAVGKYHVVGLKLDGTVTAAVIAEGDNNDGKCNVSGWKNIVAVAAGDYFTAGLKSDGAVVVTGSIGSISGVSGWKNIAAIAVSANHIIGLKRDGTVVAEGVEACLTEFKSVDASDWNWKGIVAIATNNYFSIGLKSDGTVVQKWHTILLGRSMFEMDVSYWKDIIAIAARETLAVGLRSDGKILLSTRQCAEEIAREKEYRKTEEERRQEEIHYRQLAEKRQMLEKTAHLIDAALTYTVGVKSNGTVYITGHYLDDNIRTKLRISRWKNIIAVAAGRRHTVGLKSDGTVAAVGSNGDGQCEVSDWKDIVAIAVGCGHTVGLKSDGTVTAAGKNNSGQCNVSDWKNIIAIAAGDLHTVGLKSDGTVIAAGYYYNDRQCDMSDWRNIVAIAVSEMHTLGLKSDGTVVGGNYDLDEDWKDVVAIAKGGTHAVGLKLDGTMVGSFWDFDKLAGKNIVAVAISDYHIVGLKSDGTMVATGAPFTKKWGERGDVSNWKDILAPQ